MRYINKGAEPPELVEFKAAANENWTPTYGDLDKKPIRAALAREQAYLCCYCGSRVGERQGDCHIEHLVPQSIDRSLELDYRNMLACCMASDKDPPVPAHCGGARGNKPVSVSPLSPDCAAYFTFGSDGRIEPTKEPAKHDAAEETIKNLCLDIRRLKAARSAAIDGALQGLDALSGDELRAEARTYDVPDPDGRLAPFCFAIQQVLLQYA